MIHSEDPLIRALAALPHVHHGDEPARDLRARCRARLERPAQPAMPALEPATVAAVCAIYAWQIARVVIR